MSFSFWSHQVWLEWESCITHHDKWQITKVSSKRQRGTGRHIKCSGFHSSPQILSTIDPIIAGSSEVARLNHSEPVVSIYKRWKKSSSPFCSGWRESVALFRLLSPPCMLSGVPGPSVPPLYSPALCSKVLNRHKTPWLQRLCW